VVEIFIMIAFGIIGFLMRKAGFEGAPFILALVLGPIMETSLRQSLIISRGSFAIFFSRPVSAVLMVLALTFLLTSLIPALKTRREKLAVEMGR
jgi:putative tricarboxylic transport membrane protein